MFKYVLKLTRSDRTIQIYSSRHTFSLWLLELNSPCNYSSTGTNLLWSGCSLSWVRRPEPCDSGVKRHECMVQSVSGLYVSWFTQILLHCKEKCILVTCNSQTLFLCPLQQSSNYNFHLTQLSFVLNDRFLRKFSMLEWMLFIVPGACLKSC